MKKWIERIFKIITTERAIYLNLSHVENIYGDEINKLNCRSIYEDYKGRLYRVRELKL